MEVSTISFSVPENVGMTEVASIASIIRIRSLLQTEEMIYRGFSGLSPAIKFSYGVSIAKGTVTSASRFAFSIPTMVKGATFDAMTEQVVTTAPYPIVSVLPTGAVTTQFAPRNAFLPITMRPGPLV